MMGRTHAISGPVVALAALPAVNAGLVWAGQPEVAGLALIPYVVTSAGGAVAPDWDHPHASVSRFLGPVSQAFAHVVAAVSGGHRKGTHSILGVAIFMAVTWLLAASSPWAYGAWIAIMVGAASAAMLTSFSKAGVIAHTLFVVVSAVGLMMLSTTEYLPVSAVVAGVGIGTVAHILGDMLTKQGCPIFWPVWARNFRILALTTGGGWEQALFYILVVAGLVLAAPHVLEIFQGML